MFMLYHSGHLAAILDKSTSTTLSRRLTPSTPTLRTRWRSSNSPDSHSGGPGFDSQSGHRDFGFPWFTEITPGDFWDRSVTKAMADSFLNPSCAICSVSNHLAVDNMLNQLPTHLPPPDSSPIPVLSYAQQQRHRQESVGRRQSFHQSFACGAIVNYVEKLWSIRSDCGKCGARRACRTILEHVVLIMARVSHKVLQAPSRTVGFTCRYHTLSSIQATDTSLAVVPQSPVVIHTPFARAHSPDGLRQRLLAAGLRQPPPRIFPTRVIRRGGLRRQPISPEPSCVVAKRIGNSSRREEVCDSSKSCHCRHSRDSQKRSRQPRAHLVPGRGKGEVGLRLRRGAAESAPTAAHFPSALSTDTNAIKQRRTFREVRTKTQCINTAIPLGRLGSVAISWEEDRTFLLMKPQLEDTAQILQHDWLQMYVDIPLANNYVGNENKKCCKMTYESNGEIWAALTIEILRADEGKARRVWSTAAVQGWGEIGDARENPPTSGIVRHDSICSICENPGAIQSEIEGPIEVSDVREHFEEFWNKAVGPAVMKTAPGAIRPFTVISNMPPKRKAIGRSTPQAKRKRASRASETDEQREVRLEPVRLERDDLVFPTCDVYLAYWHLTAVAHKLMYVGHGNYRDHQRESLCTFQRIVTEFIVHTVPLKTCTPVHSLAFSGDGTLDVRGNVSLIVAALLGVECVKRLQVGVDLKKVLSRMKPSLNRKYFIVLSSKIAPSVISATFFVAAVSQHLRAGTREAIINPLPIPLQTVIALVYHCPRHACLMPQKRADPALHFVSHWQLSLASKSRSGFNFQPVHSGFLHVGIVPDDTVGSNFPQGSLVSPALSFRCCSLLTSITLTGSQDLDMAIISKMLDYDSSRLTAFCTVRLRAARVFPHICTTTAISLPAAIDPTELPSNVLDMFFTVTPTDPADLLGNEWAAINNELLRADKGEARAEMESKVGRSGRFARGPADQQYRPPRFPREKVWERAPPGIEPDLPRSQSAGVSQQESLCKSQSARVSNQESVYKSQSAKVCPQDSVCKSLSSRVSRQE
ncbi:hypothetical protein PR048_019708 [Dryococelus australis]|uniref:Uncharacterized protein n=1 Tax=Dryococelus australis TaxID=614101 RepID=A0ABQ9H4B5_9NEOP|nr:hypothetical protein PR048_019708 [Dryococelus australis]